MTKTVEQKLSNLKSYLAKNGHLNEAVNVARLIDDSIEVTARSLAEGMCAPVNTNASCYTCDEGEGDTDNYTTFVLPAASREYPKITRLKRYHQDEASRRDEASHVLTGTGEAKRGIEAWKNRACQRLKGLPSVGSIIRFRNQDAMIVNITGGGREVCTGPDCQYEPAIATVQVENPETGEIIQYPVKIPRPIYSYQITGHLTPNCQISNEKVLLTEEQFMRTCFVYNDNTLSDYAHHSDRYTRDLSRDAPSDAAKILAAPIERIESEARKNQQGGCPDHDVNGECPTIMSVMNVFEVSFITPEERDEFEYGSTIPIKAELKMNNGSIDDNYFLRVYYHDRRLQGTDPRGGAYSGAFCTNLGRTTKSDDGKSAIFEGSMDATKIMPGIFRAYIAVVCGGKILHRQPVHTQLRMKDPRTG